MYMRSFGISEGNITGRKNKQKNQQNMHLITIANREVAQTLLSTTSKWGMGSEVWAPSSVFRVRTSLECLENNLRELM